MALRLGRGPGGRRADRPGRAGAADRLDPADHRLRQHHRDALDPLRKAGGPRPLSLPAQPDDPRRGAGGDQRGAAAGFARHPDPGADLLPRQHGLFHLFRGTQAGRALRRGLPPLQGQRPPLVAAVEALGG